MMRQWNAVTNASYNKVLQQFEMYLFAQPDALPLAITASCNAVVKGCRATRYVVDYPACERFEKKYNFAPNYSENGDNGATDFMTLLKIFWADSEYIGPKVMDIRRTKPKHDENTKN